MLLHAAVKLGIALAILFVSFMCFAQSGRLYSHVVSFLRTHTNCFPDFTCNCVLQPDLLSSARLPGLLLCQATAKMLTSLSLLTVMPSLPQGFMLRAVSSNLCPEHWTFEGELLAVLDMAGFLFSLGLRIFMAFGLLVCTACLCSLL